MSVIKFSMFYYNKMMEYDKISHLFVFFLLSCVFLFRLDDHCLMVQGLTI